RRQARPEDAIPRIDGHAGDDPGEVRRAMTGGTGGGAEVGQQLGLVGGGQLRPVVTGCTHRASSIAQFASSRYRSPVSWIFRGSHGTMPPSSGGQFWSPAQLQE